MEIGVQEVSNSNFFAPAAGFSYKSLFINFKVPEFRVCNSLFLKVEFKRAHREPQRDFFDPAPVRTDTAPSDYSEQFSQDCGSEPTHGIQNGISESVTVPGKDRSRNLQIESLIQKALGNCHSRKESKSPMCPVGCGSDWIRG